MKRYFGLMLVVGFLTGSMQLSADEAISITVRPAIAYANATAYLKVLVTRNERNRALVWEVDGPSYYRSSTMELEGASSPRSYFFTMRDIPAGSFEIRASVRRNDNSIAMDRSRIRVIGEAGLD